MKGFKNIYKIISITLIIFVGLIVAVIAFMFFISQSIKFLEGQTHFTNDISEDAEVLLFAYDNYSYEEGDIIGPFHIKFNQTESLWEPYPLCMYFIKSGESFMMPGFPDHQTNYLLSDILSGDPCPVDLGNWEPNSKWSCKRKAKIIEPCVRLDGGQEVNNWKTYKNDQYGFTFEYTGDWHQVSPFPELVSVGSDKPPYEDNYYGGMIGPSGTIIDFWVVTDTTPFNPGEEEISKESITIDGVQGEKIISQTYYKNNQDDPKIKKIIEIRLKKNNVGYYIRGSFPYKSTQEDHMKIFDQITSTIKF